MEYGAAMNFDFDALVRPLELPSRCGEDLMFSDVFDDIQEARRHDDPSLDQGEWVTELKEADWARVVRLCSELLASRTKDLRIAAWLAEALAKTRGLAGLGYGYLLLARLCENYWDDIHPQAEEGDQELRIGTLDWLLAQSARLVREMPITDSDRGRYAYVDLEAARALAQALERNPAEAAVLAAGGRVSQEQFDAALRDTPTHWLVDNLDAARAAHEALGELQQVIDARLGAEGPAFGATRENLAAVMAVLERFVAQAGGMSAAPVPPPEPDVAAALPPSTVARPALAPSSAGGLASREQALRQLREVAEFFRRTEPHSPVAYLAAKAARWGEMSLHEWLRTVLKDGGALSHVEELLGVDPQGGDGG